MGTECVAEVLRRPLYRINGSEIGDGVGEIERRLTQAFTRTARWGSILLLDEAETFMARRGSKSLERNAVVTCEQSKHTNREHCLAQDVRG